MFEPLIRQCWWKIFVSLIANRSIVEGQHYRFDDGRLYVSFKALYDQYMHTVVSCGKDWQLRVSEARMKQILAGSDNYVSTTRKRLSRNVNVHVLVFEWNTGAQRS
jgi:hypothetical protein